MLITQRIPTNTNRKRCGTIAKQDWPSCKHMAQNVCVVGKRGQNFSASTISEVAAVMIGVSMAAKGD